MMRRLLFLLLLGVPQPAFSQVVINEVLYDPTGTDTGTEKIEIMNLGLSSADLTGYDLYPDGIGYFTFPSFMLNAGSIVVVHLRLSGTNSATDLYHSVPVANMGNSVGSVALFSGTIHNSSTLVSFVQWGSGGQTWAGTAVTAGFWGAATDFVPIVPEGHSLEYDGSGDASSDWFDQPVPTIGGNNSLPVQMTEFTAEGGLRSAGGGFNAELRWKTETEVENYGFEIQRRSVGARAQRGEEVAENDSRFTIYDSPRWSTVGFVRGSGTSSSPHEYSFLDQNLSAGRYAYRIKQIDHDGSFTYTSALEVEVGLAPSEFTLSQNYPNPFNPITTMEFTLPHNGRVVLKVYNLSGEVVATLLDDERPAGRIQQVIFDASGLSSGTYFARLRSANRELVKKIMVLK